jgi:microcystin-dependent protein
VIVEPIKGDQITSAQLFREPKSTKEIIMDFRQTGDMHRPDANWWNEALNTYPSKNLEAAYFDLSFSDGVVSGLEVVPANVPNRTVIIKPGRAIVRDEANRTAKVIDLPAQITLDLTSSLPIGSTTTVLIVAEYRLRTDLEAPVLVQSPPVGHPNHDATFADYLLYSRETDGSTIRAVGSLGANQVILASVTLQNGQTQILSTHISILQREIATVAPQVAALVARVAEIENSGSFIGEIRIYAGDPGELPGVWLPCDFREISRTDFPVCFSRLGINFGNGNGTTTFNLPPFAGRVPVGATPSGQYTRGSKGGYESVALRVDQMPKHAFEFTTDNDGEHGHYMRGAELLEGGGMSFVAPVIKGGIPNIDNWVGNSAGSTSSSNSETDVPAGAILGYGVVAKGSSHQHHGESNEVGGNVEHENRMPYLSIPFIIRVK